MVRGNPFFSKKLMKEKIVQNAWGLVSQFHSLKKLNFLPSAFGMIWLLMILVYQVTFALATSFNKTDDVWNFLKHLPNEPYFISLVVGVICQFLKYKISQPFLRRSPSSLLRFFCFASPILGFIA